MGTATTTFVVSFFSVERYLQQLRASELKKLMLERDLPLLFNTSHILPLLVGDARKCKEVCDLLLEKYKVSEDIIPLCSLNGTAFSRRRLSRSASLRLWCSGVHTAH